MAQGIDGSKETKETYKSLQNTFPINVTPDDVTNEENKAAVLSLHYTEGLQRNVHQLFHALIVALVVAGIFAGFFAYYLGAYHQLTLPETVEDVPSKG